MKPISQCPVCGGKRLAPYAMREWAPGCLHLAQAVCADCGLLCSQPQATQDETDAFYKQVYYQEVWSDPERAYQDNTKWYRRNEWPLLQQLWKDWPPQKGGAAFEVGCGYGVMLNLLRDEGFKVSGTELSARAVEACRSRRLDVVEADLTAHVPSDSQDLICSLHVIEHVFDPLAFIQEMVRIVRPGGVIFLVTEDGWNSQYQLRRWRYQLQGRIPPTHTSADHTFVFQQKHLRSLLTRAGCDEVRTVCYSPSSSNESLHWKAFKASCRRVDKLLGHGEYLLATARKRPA